MVKRVLFDITPGLIDAAETATARLTTRTTVETVEDTEDLGQFDEDPSTGWADFPDETPAGSYRFVVAINGNYGLAKGMVTLGTDAGVYLLDDANIGSIKAKTDLITSDGITINQPAIESGQFTDDLIIGDDYLAANGRAITWTVPLPTGTTVGGSSCKLFFRYGDYALTVNGAVADAGDGNATMSFDISRTDSANLVEGDYDWYGVYVGDGGVEMTLVRHALYKKVRWIERPI